MRDQTGSMDILFPYIGANGNYYSEPSGYNNIYTMQYCWFGQYGASL
jgi:hypothetical protein